MGLFTFSRRLLLKPEFKRDQRHLNPTRDGFAKPLSLFDLPKEIRLMIYGQLEYCPSQHRIPLGDRTHYLTLVNQSISGVLILATCRLINDEASIILRPAMEHMLRQQPRIIIEAKHLVGLVPLWIKPRSLGYQNTVLDRILESLNCHMEDIHRYRKGECSAEKLQARLGLKHLIDKTDHASLNAIVSFILRTAKYERTAPYTPYKNPPITIAIKVPEDYQSLTTTISTPRTPALLLYRLTGIGTIRAQTEPTTLGELVKCFAYHASLLSSLSDVVSFNVTLKYVSNSANRTVPQVVRGEFQAAIQRGLVNADREGLGLLGWGGVEEVEEEHEDELSDLRHRVRIV